MSMLSLERPETYCVHVVRSESGRLFFDGVDLMSVATEYGTPTWVTSLRVVRENWLRLGACLEARFSLASRVAYSMKANTTSRIVTTVLELGGDFDISSETELLAAAELGVPGDRILLNGSCKSQSLVRVALEAGCSQISIDVFDDIDMILGLVSSVGREVRCIIRIRPRIGVKEGSCRLYRTLDADDGKFGFDWRDHRFATVLRRLCDAGLRPSGVHVHHGFLGYSGDFTHHDEVARRRFVVRDALECIVAHRPLFASDPLILNVGGGTRSALNVVVRPPKDEGWRGRATTVSVAPVEEHVRLIAHEIQDAGMSSQIEVQLESGGFLVDTSTIMLAEIIGEVERCDGTRLVMLNASTRTFVTQARATYPALLVQYPERASVDLVTIVGHSCAPDNLVTGWPLPRDVVGKVVALLNQGAYCEAESTQFNGLPRPGVVVLDGTHMEMVKEREGWKDQYFRDTGYVTGLR